MDNENTVLKEETYSFSLLKALYKNLVLIILCTVFGALLGLGYGVIRVKPVYTKTSTVMLVTGIESSSYSNNLVLGQYYLKDVAMILQSTEFIEEVNAEYSENGGTGEISSGSISFSYGNDDSLIFSISYSDSSYELAEKKLNAIITHSQERLVDLIKADSVKLKETNNVKSETYKYNYTKHIVIGLLAGCVLAVGYTMLKYFLDNTVKDRLEIEEITGVNVLACIVDQPQMQTKRR